MEVDCDDYDTKPIEIARLLGKISALLKPTAAEQTAIATMPSHPGSNRRKAMSARMSAIGDNRTRMLTVSFVESDPKPIAFGASAEANAQMSASHPE
jgi:hypothetical protein